MLGTDQIECGTVSLGRVTVLGTSEGKQGTGGTQERG